MSILSKLLNGDKNAEKEAKDLLNGLLNGEKNVEKEAKNLLNGLFGNEKQDQKASSEEAGSEKYTQAPETVENNVFSGVPEEENQYNYNGTYEQYFEHIFSEDFSDYSFEKSYIDDYGKHRVIYMFFSGDKKVLAVELMTESSEAAKFRSDCMKAGIPYLRFYYDHEGWWNIRSYVVNRIREALKG